MCAALWLVRGQRLEENEHDVAKQYPNPFIPVDVSVDYQSILIETVDVSCMFELELDFGGCIY